MSVETPDQAVVEEPQGTSAEPQGTDTTDWKAEARKWEKYAKENKAAKDELDAIKAAQMSEQEKLEQRVKDAESKLAAANARIQHAQDVAEVAAASGVPANLLEFCSDREAMESFAEQYGANAPQVHSAPQALKVRLVDGSKPQATTGDMFAELVAPLFTS